jgi:hypothetical protein
MGKTVAGIRTNYRVQIGRKLVLRRKVERTMGEEDPS